jgi:tetratricopeptide (TPR) repeat protein
MNRVVLCLFLCCGMASAASPEQQLFETLGGSKALEKGEFKFVRSAVAKYFEATHAEEIDKSFGSDAEAIKKFLSANPELRDTLYTAIDPNTDGVMGALEIFRDLYKLGPDNLKAHPQLAVALCVVWDQPKAVYDQTPHQVRTKSLLPTGVKDVNHVLNWQQFLADEKALGGVTPKLPWEFLVHVVNHKSVKEERIWAVKSYGKRRAMIGSIYPTVEYDTKMLQTKSAVCKLNGQPYDLPGILKHGGVCAMQADFAARVGKSVLIPSEYVGGEGASGVLHAWVMWAEVKSVSAEGKVDFTMQREGAYLIDNYYVGTLRDPKSGDVTTDRDVTRRLAFLGGSPTSARHADLLMKAYPALAKQRDWKQGQRQNFLQGVLDIFQYDEKAWLEFAAFHKSGSIKDSDAAYASAVKCFDAFARHPDFAWQLLPDFLSAVKDPARQTKLYERAVTAFEALGRPDLACEARLTLSGVQAEAKEYKKAADGLASTIRRFPDEGRYVPKMMKELVSLCEKFDGGTDLLAKFYTAILPKVPKTRGDEVSQYCIKMHEQAIDFFTKVKKPADADRTKTQLYALKKLEGK